jgi:hypothetical protein
MVLAFATSLINMQIRDVRTGRSTDYREAVRTQVSHIDRMMVPAAEKYLCPAGAIGFSPGFQPWETSNKAVRPERARDCVVQMRSECYRKGIGYLAEDTVSRSLK